MEKDQQNKEIKEEEKKRKKKKKKKEIWLVLFLDKCYNQMNTKLV